MLCNLPSREIKEENQDPIKGIKVSHLFLNHAMQESLRHRIWIKTFISGNVRGILGTYTSFKKMVFNALIVLECLKVSRQVKGLP
jgi:hypothetical protein